MPPRHITTALPARVETPVKPEPKPSAVGRPSPINPTLLPREAPGRDWRPAFLAALAEHGVVTSACQQANIHRSTVYHHRDTEPDFAAAWDEAVQMSNDLLVRIAIRRATEGTLKPDYYQGKVIGATADVSDRLMELTLKARLPDEYGDKLTVRLPKDAQATLAEYGLTVSEALMIFITGLQDAK